MNINITTSLQALCEGIKDAFGNRCLNYGEGIESLIDGQAANFVTTDGSTFCSVNDAYDLVLFFIRQSSTPSTQQGGGMKNSLFRITTFRMAVNSKKAIDEYAIAAIVNNTQGITYIGSSYESRAIASQMFGLDERDYHTAFFTIDFTAIEKITCYPC